MLPAQSFSEAHPANRADADRPSGRLQAGASSSPKMQELRARFEAIHATLSADQGTRFQHSNSR